MKYKLWLGRGWRDRLAREAGGLLARGWGIASERLGWVGLLERGWEDRLARERLGDRLAGERLGDRLASERLGGQAC